MMSQDLYATHVDGPEREKLSQLRTRTDRQILKLIHSRLEKGWNLAALAEAERSDGNRAWTANLEYAGQALTEAQKLLPLVREEQRPAIDSKLSELQQALERFSCERGSLTASV